MVSQSKRDGKPSGRPGSQYLWSQPVGGTRSSFLMRQLHPGEGAHIMIRKLLTPLWSVVILLGAATAFAQGSSDTPRAYLSALGGVTFGSEAGGQFGAGINVVANQ